MNRASGSAGPINLLLLEPEVAAARQYRTLLEHGGIEIRHMRSAREDTLEADLAGSIVWDVAIVSFTEHDGGPAASVQRIREAFPHIAVVALSAQGSLTQAVEVMRLGADDFLVKPVSRGQLVTAVERAQDKASRRASDQLAVRKSTGAENIIGTSPVIRRMLQTIERAAASKATVFLEGESGTGKELCAQAVHELSPRADGPMISLNCSAIPRELMESEIFGHDKGAFTGAAHAREGAAERADGGTLFLDEICEMDLALQAKLLRFIQTGQFTRVGGSQLRVATLTTHASTSRARSAGIPRALPSSSTPKKITPPSALANATISAAMSSVFGDPTPRFPSRTSLTSARPSTPAGSCL